MGFKKVGIILVAILISIFYSLLVIAPGGYEGSTGDFKPIDNPDQASQLAQSGGEATIQQDLSFQSPHDSKVDVKSGTHMYSDGSTITLDSDKPIKEDDREASNGEVIITENTFSVNDADSVKTPELSAVGVTDLNIMKNTDAFDVKHADAIEIPTSTGTITLTNVDNLKYLNGNFEIEQADYIKTNEYEAVKVKDFSSEAQKITLISADTLSSDCLEISNIQNAEIIIDNNKIFDKSKHIELIDCLNHNVTFEGHGEGSALIVSKNQPYSYSISKGTLTLEHEDYTELLYTDSTAAATLNHFGFTTIEMQPASSYAQINKNNQNNDFKISLPENSTKFLLFLRNSENEQQPDTSFCEQCGMIDFVEKKIEFKGTINYKKQGSYIYQSYDLNEAFMQLDKDFIMIETLNLDNQNPKAGRLADIYNGDYLIYETMEDEVVARVAHTDMHPMTIKQYNPLFNEKHRLITFDNGALIFDPDNPNKTIIRSESFEGLTYLKQEIQKYQSKFTQCMTNINSTFLGWLDE